MAALLQPSAMLTVYTKYFDFDDEVWSDWRLDADGRFATCLDLIVVMEDLYNRLIFKMDQPKFNILFASRYPTSPSMGSVLYEITCSIACSLARSLARSTGRSEK